MNVIEAASAMGALEIIGGILLLLASVAIIVLTMAQESQKNALSGLGGDDSSYFGQNSGRTLNAVLFRFTKIAAVVFFVVTILVYAITVYK